MAQWVAVLSLWGGASPRSHFARTRSVPSQSPVHIWRQHEARCPRSGYSIDMLVHRDAEDKVSECWAVEFDGPHHFLVCVGANAEPTGATLMKRRHLELLGYRLISVPYWEWDNLRGFQRQGYLRGKLGLPTYT